MSVASTLIEHNLDLKEVWSDGNCFFASLVICLAALPQGKQKTSITALRQRFSAHLAARVDELSPFFFAEEDQREEYEEAVKKIRRTKIWDHQIIDLVVGCATEVLQMNVTIFDIDNDGNVTEYAHVYEPEDNDELDWPTINLLRQDDNHFNALIPLTD